MRHPSEEGVPDAASLHFAAETMLARVEDLQAQLPHLYDPPDPEPVHRTRVACRRLRTAFDLFEGCLPRKRRRRWDERVRRLGRALGQARDLDVQIEFLAGFVKEVDIPTARPGLERLQLRLLQRRAEAQQELRRKVRKFDRSHLISDLEQTLRETAVHTKLAAGAEPPHWIWRSAGTRVLLLAEQVLIHEPFVEQPERSDEHHEMRIAAKHLRYALEVYSPLYEGQLRTPFEAARNLQRTLGALHDCDVWIEFLPRFIARERRRTKKFLGHLRGFRRIAQGLEALLADRRRMRERIHAQFVEQWRRECGDMLWNDLRRVLLSHADGAAGGVAQACAAAPALAGGGGRGTGGDAADVTPSTAEPETARVS